MVKFRKKIKKFILFFIFIFILFLILGIFLIKPQIDKIPYSTIIYDQNNIKIGEIIVDNKYRHQKINFEEIPDFTKKVIISLEDKSFFSNIGIDFLAISRAILNNFSGKNIQGASTISSQVIRNNYWLNEKRTIWKKIKEFYLAIALNASYSKEEILSNYLGNIYFGYLNYGMKSASEYYFGKELKNLTNAEQLALIILPQNPKKYDPYKNRYEFKTRLDFIANTLKENNVINQKIYESIISEKLVFNYDHKNKLPYVVDFIRNSQTVFPIDKVIFEKEKKPQFLSLNSQVYTTIDYNLTKKIEEIAKNSIIPLFWKNVKDYSTIIIDRNTNEIKVMIGGINYYDDNGQVSMITATRQAGSTLKPFTYVLAFKNLGYTPETTILDLPVQFQNDMGYAYNPKNYSLDYKGEVSVAEALSQSINIPAIKVADEIGVGNLLNFLRQVGFTSLTKDENYYGLALTLGVGEVSLYELTRSYSIFAYDGNLCDFKIVNNSQINELIKEENNQKNLPTSLYKKENNECKQIIDKKYTDMINYILSNRYFKINAFPINGNLDFPDKEVFLKTGTSRNFKDNWTIGFTKNYIVGVWAGNKDGSEMKGVSGASGAGEIFKAIVDYLEKETKQNEPIKIQKDKIDYLEITSPLANSKYQFSQNTPKESQKIKLEFKTNLDYKTYKWFLNGKYINNEFIDIIPGNKELKLILYDKDDFMLKETSLNFFVE